MGQNNQATQGIKIRKFLSSENNNLPSRNNQTYTANTNSMNQQFTEAINSKSEQKRRNIFKHDQIIPVPTYLKTDLYNYTTPTGNSNQLTCYKNDTKNPLQPKTNRLTSSVSDKRLDNVLFPSSPIALKKVLGNINYKSCNAINYKGSSNSRKSLNNNIGYNP